MKPTRIIDLEVAPLAVEDDDDEDNDDCEGVVVSVVGG